MAFERNSFPIQMLSLDRERKRKRGMGKRTNNEGILVVINE